MVEIKHKLVALLDEVRRSSAPLDWQIPLAAYQFSSLQTVSLWLGIKKTFRLSLAMQDLLDMPSLNHLAESIHAHCLNTPDASTAQGCLESTQPAPALPPVLDTHAPFALTPIQQSYFMARQDEQDPDAVGCNLYREFSLDSPDLVRLQAAWHQVLAHQPMLRVRFVPEGRQSILPEVPATDMPCRTLVHGDNVESAIQATRSRLMRWRFAPGQAGFVIEVTRLPDDDTIVHFCIDGMLTDGVGLALVMQQWRHVYQQADARLPELPCSVPAALLELDARRQDAGYALDLAYWQQRLHAMPGAPKLVQPAQDDLGNHGSQSGVSNQNRQSQLSKNASHSALPASLPRQTLSRRIDAITWASLQQQASTLGISPTSLVLAVFADCLYQASSQQAFSLVLTTNHRPWLKYQAQGLMGPFTSSMVFVPGHDDGISLSQYAQAVHAALWQDISHGAVDGIAALRQLRKAGGQVSALPVVFTSMLDLASQLPAAHAMDEQLRHECSITSGVALEHEIREQQGALLLRWDVDIARFPLHQMEALFARYVNLLASLPQVAFGVASARAGQLQQAYLVARSAGSEGCQIYQSFHMPSVDVPRLQHAMLRLINHFEVLRTTLQANGQLSVMPEAPSEFFICEVDLASQSDAAGYLAACRQAMLETSFAPGRWPQFELRVTRDASNGATVHCAFDLALQDAVSILQLPRQLLALYSDPAIQLPDQLPGAQLQHAKNLIDSSPAQANLHAYWEQRLQDLPPGPVWAAPQQERQRLRLEGQLREWPHLRQRIEAAGVSVDAWFSAVLIEVLGTWPSADFGLTVVRWPSAHEPWRPAELTGLSWLSSAAASGQAKLMSRARAHHALFSSEAPAIAAPGLASLRKMLAKRAQPFALPLVYTGVFDMALPALPPGVRSGAWQTCTPEVSLDVVSLVDGERLQFFWDVVENDFPPGQIRAMFGRYQEVLQALACQDCDWEKFDMSIYAAPTGAAWPDPEREKILYGWNQTAANYPIDQLPYQLIENQAACQPQAIALRGKQGSQSFSELNQYANHLAWQLKDAGVKRETLVAICVHPGFLMVAAVLAIHKAGGAYLPLDPTLPPERMATILHEAGVAHVIVDQAAMPPLFSHQVQIMAFAQTLPASLDPRSLHNPPCVATVANSAYIIYTSGSTGKPKGVLVAHQALLNLLNWANKEFAFDQKDCGLAVASLGFDLSVFDLFGLLGSGASLYVADATERKDPTLLLDILLQHPITFWNSSPAALHQLGTLLPGVRNAAGREYLRLVFLSGDFTPLSLPDEVRATFPHATIINLGGATEATVWSNYFRVGAIDDNWRSIPYGIPIDNARYHVLDDDLEPCRVGVEGDLYIGGDCLSIGYWQQGALTAKSFVPDPYAKTPGQRLYRTGDRVAYLPDGNLTFIGRIDGQVKIRGNRVELGEIDFQLRSHPAIKEALTLARDDHTGDRKLVAYVIAKRERPAAKTLREHVAKTLPAYMVPNFVCFIDAFPSTANGKLDRNALPWPVPREETPASAPPVATTQPELPTLEALMQTLQQLFAEQLMSGSIGIDSDLWDFGATSFTLIQVSNSLQKQYGCRVPVSSLVAAATVRAIATTLQRMLQDGRKAGGAGVTHAAAGTITDSAIDAGVAVRTDMTSASSMAANASFGNTATAATSTTHSDSRISTGAVEATPLPTPLDTRAAADTQLPAGSIDLLDAKAVAAFKAGAHHLRQFGSGIGLPSSDFNPAYYQWRATRRDFLPEALPLARLAQLLSVLRAANINGGKFSLYGSAGGTYAVQVYLHVKPGAVAGLAGGSYYYHPQQHALHLIDGNAAIAREQHFYYNRPLFDQAGFSLFMFGEGDAIAPLYGDEATRYLMLEAGHMAQLLCMNQAASQIGLCGIGALDVEALRNPLQLKPSHQFVYAFLGGPVAALANSGETPWFADATALALAQAATPSRAPLAIIGMAGRFAGANSIDALWQQLKAGQRSIGPVPVARDWAAEFPALQGGFIDDIASFDSLLFQIAPREAALLDPQTRLLLQVVWQTLEQAGYTADSLRAAAPRVGVFVAVMWHDYQQVGNDAWRNDGALGVAGSGSDIANRISHFFHFTGPSLAINTSCSSSLTALQLAQNAMAQGQCDAAVVAAVNLMAHPYHAGLLHGLNLLSGQAQPQAFDANVSGWTPGEGCAAVLLRAIDQAASEHDQVVGVLDACQAVHVGKVARYGAPDAQELAASMRAALAQAGLGVEEIDYVECAAAGAGIADSAELEALQEVFGQRQNRLVIGTIKPNIGHLEAAAGMSQLAKVLLQFGHQQLAPTLLPPSEQRLAVLQDGSLRLVEMAEVWHGKVAMINAIGASGTYVHAIVRAAPAYAASAVTNSVPAVPIHVATQEELLPLSAASQEQLLQLAASLLAHLRAAQPAPNLADVAMTLQTGRVALAARLTIRCRSLAQLQAVLERVVQQRPDPLYAMAEVASIVHPGQANLASNNAQLAEQWLAGANVDWASLWAKRSARRVGLPGYPFAKVPYWLASQPRIQPAYHQAVEMATANVPVPTMISLKTDSAAASIAPQATLALEDSKVVPHQVEAWLCQLYSDCSGIPLVKVHPGGLLAMLGLSSLIVVEMNAALAKVLGQVSKTLLFEYPDLAGVARHVWHTHRAALIAFFGYSGGAALSGASTSSAAVTGHVAVSSASPASGLTATASSLHAAPDADSLHDIAIIGIAGRYPGADTLEQFWNNLEAGVDCIRQIPPKRAQPHWPVGVMWGGFLDEVDTFDPLFFNISPRDADMLDPQARLFLQVMWNTLQDAGYGVERLRQRHDGQCGVFVGAMYGEYRYFGVEAANFGPEYAVSSGTTLADIANRCSYFLGVTGPSMTIDTMCSSSLTALHLAIQSLRRQECQVAVVGGVNLSLHPDKYIAINRLKMASSDHRCRSFGAGGDGFVPGEGAGAVLLKPLAKALADGDRIHAVIKGSAINHGGKSNGYMVPNPQAHASLVRAALIDAAVSPASISYVEAHGTGTSLGDPVEINGLMRAFNAEVADSVPATASARGKVAIGSVKSQIGHLEAAAGMAGLAKLVLQMQHQRFAASLHAETLNPNIDWDQTPFQVQREAAAWHSPVNTPRRASISSFGAGGANAHVIVEQAVMQQARRFAPMAQGDEGDLPGASQGQHAETLQLLVLSAKTADALKKMAERLASQWQAQPQLRLADVALTLQIGRDAMVHRFGVVVVNAQQALQALNLFVRGEAGTYLVGKASLDVKAESGMSRFADLPAGHERAQAMLRHFIQGGNLDRQAQPRQGDERIVSLPGYPFARQRCWFPDLPERSLASHVPTPELSPVTAHVLVPTMPSPHLSSPTAGTPAMLQLHWQAEALPISGLVPVTGRVLLWFGSQSAQLAQHLALALRSQGAEVSLQYCDDHMDAAILIASCQGGMPFAGWIDLSDLGQTRRSGSNWRPRLALLQASLQAQPLRVMQVQNGLLVTGGAVTAQVEPNLAAASMASFVKVLAAEHKKSSWRVLDLEWGAQDAMLATLLQEWQCGESSVEVAYRAGVRLVPGWRPAKLGASESSASAGAHPSMSASLAGEWPQSSGLASDSSMAAHPFSHDKAVIITGGLRGLGAMLAQQLATLGVRKLALIGNRALPVRAEWQRSDLPQWQQDAIADIRKLEAQGVAVKLAFDVLRDAAALNAFLADVRRDLGVIGGVIHCAGSGSQGRPAFVYKTQSDLEQALAAKVEGLHALADACADDNLAYFLLFSSVSAVLPALGAGVADYAAANAYMDYFANYQQARGHTEFCAVNWPFWAQSTGSSASLEACERLGLAAISDAEGVAILRQILAGPFPANVLPLPSRPGVALEDVMGHLQNRSPMLANSAKLAATSASAQTLTTTALPAMPQEVHVAVPLNPSVGALSAGLVSATVPATLLGVPALRQPVPWLIQIFSDMLRISLSDMDLDANFSDLGVESVMMVELIHAIEKQSGTPLEPSALLDHASVNELAAHLGAFAPVAQPSVAPTTQAVDAYPQPAHAANAAHASHAAQSDASQTQVVAHVMPAHVGPASIPAQAVRSSARSMDIAIIGMSARFPDAPDLQTFWVNLQAGHCAVREVPATRWDVGSLYQKTWQTGKSTSKWGAFISGIEDFDPAFFGMSQQEAIESDPAIRLILEEAANCMSDAGLPQKALAGKDVGIYIGARMSGYRRRMAGVLGQAGLGGDQNFIAARIAHHFDWHGQCMVVDTACSSALSALQLACHSLALGESELALAGGVDILLDEEPYLEFSEARALSPSGRCHTFDRSADGFVPGEGCGVMLLKPLEAALRDGDPIRAVIRGISANNDGKTMGLTTPNPKAQSQVIRRALAQSGMRAEQIGMIEAHGTGTMIGDPIELKALTNVFLETTRATGFCPIGSVKSNVGHLLSAAGMAGLMKAVLCIEHGQVVPTLFCDEPNPRFDFKASPFYPNTRLQPWPQPIEARVAGISAFGLGGTNVHVIVSGIAARSAVPVRARLPRPVFQRVRCWLEPLKKSGTVATVDSLHGESQPLKTAAISPLRLQFGSLSMASSKLSGHAV